MSDPVARLNAALEGRYRIERQLGEARDEDPALGRIYVILDWFRELVERVPR